MYVRIKTSSYVYVFLLDAVATGLYLEVARKTVCFGQRVDRQEGAPTRFGFMWHFRI
jgi:hypothetical protein